MVVNFEFLGDEPIENVITCLNYKVDRVVFFGYNEQVDRLEKSTGDFLKKYCGVQSVCYCIMPEDDIETVLSLMREQIEQELSQGNEIFFDITGGASLILVAFGILSAEYKLPMHLFDVAEDRIIELEEGADRQISTDAQQRKIKLTPEMYIEMHGGVINSEMQKGINANDSRGAENIINIIWKISKKYRELWNPFLNFMQSNLAPDEDMWVERDYKFVLEKLSERKIGLNKPRELNGILDELERNGLIEELVHSDGLLRFKFRNSWIKNYLWNGGTILEMRTYFKEKKNSDFCMSGVHIDWDGNIHSAMGTDIVNEIDVLSLTGNVMKFISCKSGKLGAPQMLHALYELDSVAEKFGGKYAKKVLVKMNDCDPIYIERAKEMGIEVITEK